VHYCLEDKDVLFLHLFNLKLESCSQFHAILKLRELNHLPFFYVYPEASRLINDLRFCDVVSLFFAQFSLLVNQGH
jgi:hypothetical protein